MSSSNISGNNSWLEREVLFQTLEDDPRTEDLEAVVAKITEWLGGE